MIEQYKNEMAEHSEDISRVEENVPDYLKEVYDWAYVNPKYVRFLDHDATVWSLLFLNAGRLMNRYLDLIEPGMRVWQVAHVYGSLVVDVANKVGKDGTFHLTDCTPVQLEQAHRKLDVFSQARVIASDAALYQADQHFDVVCSFMLLHEVPEDMKHKIVDRMLDNVTEDGKVIFVDYHNPKKYWQPFRTILQLVNYYLEPFSNALWKNEIQSYASRKDEFDWQKETIFGGVYQCVIATRKK